MTILRSFEIASESVNLLTGGNQNPILNLLLEFVQKARRFQAFSVAALSIIAKTVPTFFKLKSILKSPICHSNIIYSGHYLNIYFVKQNFSLN